VERAPGVKDPAMIESFVRTVRAIGRDASLAVVGDR
jgi:hypothetical protein